MVPYTQLFDDVMPELPGAGQTLVLHHIKRACNDFYERSLFVRQDLAPIDVVSATATYALAVQDPANYELSKVLRVTYDGKPIWPRTSEDLDKDAPEWQTRQGVVSHYTSTVFGQLTLAYIPGESITGGLKVNVAVVPQYGGGGIDQLVYDKFSEVLAAGVKARLMRMQKKPWSNPTLAERYETYFDDEVGGATAIAARGFGRAPLRSRACP